MFSEVNFNSIDFDEFDPYWKTSRSSYPCTLYKAIFSQVETSYSMKITPYEINMLTTKAGKAYELFVEKKMKPMKSGGSGSVEIDISWGGKEGVEVTFGGKAEAHDDNGNYVEIKAEQNCDGTGNVNISAGHEEE